MANLLRVGQTAPTFEAPDQAGRTIRLGDLRGHWVVLYFYPKDQTTGCTIEACGFRDRHRELLEQDTVVLGVSHDDVESHRRFAERRHLPFSLLADPDQRILRAYGTRRWFGWARRTTYIIDPRGRIARVYPRVWAKDHSEHVLSDLRELRLKQDTKVPELTTAP